MVGLQPPPGEDDGVDPPGLTAMPAPRASPSSSSPVAPPRSRRSPPTTSSGSATAPAGTASSSSRPTSPPSPSRPGARAAIEQRGYDIVLDASDQESDLNGGHADRLFKLPNPYYFIAD
jgi:hypothetical protein